MLDRTTDALPPFFTLYPIESLYSNGVLESQKIGGNPIPIDGQELWGDGISWKQAESKMLEAIASL